MEKLGIFCLVTIVLFCNNFGAIDGKYLPTILWDSRNFLFGCKDLTIYVQFGDNLMLACPSTYLYSRYQKENIPQKDTFETIYGVTEEQVEKFNTCNSTGLEQLHNCSIKNEFYQLGIVPTTFPQDEAMTYYLFSTSFLTEENRYNKINGSCIGHEGYHPLKLKIYKCAKDDTHERCQKPCQNMDCYLEDCGIWNEWVKEDTFFWNGTSCLQKRTRSCSTHFPCKGDKEMLSVTGAGNCTLNECPSPSLSPTPSTSIASSAPPLSSCSVGISSCSQCSCSTNQEISTSRTTATATTIVTATATSTSTMTTTVIVESSVDVTSSEVSSFGVTSSDATLSDFSSSDVIVVTPIIVMTTVYVTSTVIFPAASIVTVKETVTQTTCDITCSTTTGETPTPRVEYRKQDIVYDDKFYITVISAIVGAILVGVFVAHACRSYKKGNKIKINKVIKVKEYNRAIPERKLTTTIITDSVA